MESLKIKSFKDTEKDTSTGLSSNADEIKTNPLLSKIVFMVNGKELKNEEREKFITKLMENE